MFEKIAQEAYFETLQKIAASDEKEQKKKKYGGAITSMVLGTAGAGAGAAIGNHSIRDTFASAKGRDLAMSVLHEARGVVGAGTMGAGALLAGAGGLTLAGRIKKNNQMKEEAKTLKEISKTAAEEKIRKHKGERGYVGSGVTMGAGAGLGTAGIVKAILAARGGKSPVSGAALAAGGAALAGAGGIGAGIRSHQNKKTRAYNAEIRDQRVAAGK